jgi:hypothetical protein
VQIRSRHFLSCGIRTPHEESCPSPRFESDWGKRFSLTNSLEQTRQRQRVAVSLSARCSSRWWPWSCPVTLPASQLMLFVGLNQGLSYGH